MSNLSGVTPRVPWGGPSIYDGALGGTSVGGDPDSYFPELWEWLIDSFGITSVLDVGCGCGFTQEFFECRDVMTIGLEGSRKVVERHLRPAQVIHHDLRQPWCGPRFDLVWSCEVGEHIDKDEIDCFLDIVAEHARKVVAFCAAPPGAGGHHHVNCVTDDTWAGWFAQRGLRVDEEKTVFARSLCVPKGRRGPQNYFRRSGLVLIPQ